MSSKKKKEEMTKELGFFTPTQLELESNETLTLKHKDSMDIDTPLNGSCQVIALGEEEENLKQVDTSLLTSAIKTEFKTKSHDKLITDIYNLYLKESNTEFKQLLEQNYYIERVLIPFYPSKKTEPISNEHTLSLVMLFNEKKRLKLPVWTLFSQDSQNKLVLLFGKTCRLFLDPEISLLMKTEILGFLIQCFASLDHPVLHSEAMRLVNIGIFKHLQDESVRDLHFSHSPNLNELWKRFNGKLEGIEKQSTRDRIVFEQGFISHSILFFMEILFSVEAVDLQDPQQVQVKKFCTTFVQLLIDLESQLSTRRYFHTLLQDHLVILYAKQSFMYKSGHEALLKKNSSHSFIPFAHLMDMLDLYAHFEMDETTGTVLSKTEKVSFHYEKIQKLQKKCFLNFKNELLDFSLSNVGSIDSPKALTHHLSLASRETLVKLCKEYGITTLNMMTREPCDKDWLVQSLVYHFQSRRDVLDNILKHPLFPTESVIFDDSRVPYTQDWLSDSSYLTLSIPKLTNSFTSLRDYLYRNYFLYRYEAAFKLREDIVDAALRLAPKYNGDSKVAHTVFKGTCRYALAFEKFEIVSVGETTLEGQSPTFVKANIQYSLQNYSSDVVSEWDSLRSGDVLYLISFKFNSQSTSQNTSKHGQGTLQSLGLQSIRGCTVSSFIDHVGNPIQDSHFHSNDKVDRSTGALSSDRTLSVFLEPEQYQLDYSRFKKHESPDIPTTFNVLLRRESGKDVYVSWLESIRQLLKEDVILPDWLHDLFLGYGDNKSVNLSSQPVIPFHDTFVDVQHVESSFPLMKVEAPKDAQAPFELTFSPSFYTLSSTPSSTQPVQPVQKETPSKTPRGRKRKASDASTKPQQQQPDIIVSPKGTSCQKNHVKFNPPQIQAIHSGFCQGLTLVSGPPGSGKSRVSAQIISNLYHAYPNQHILLVSQEHAALEKIFDVLTEYRNVDPMHVLTLGYGSGDFATDGKYGRQGRINASLEKRIHVLRQVDALAKSCKIQGDHASNCQTALYFFDSHIVPLWKSFIKSCKTKESLVSDFPFKSFVSDFSSLSAQDSYENTLKLALAWYQGIQELFSQVKQVQGLELFRSESSRSEYLTCFQARIIGMTAPYAAAHRDSLLNLGFTYDTVVMHEAHKIMEIQAFLTLTCQPFSGDTGKNLLKRIVLVGDKDALPVSVSNRVLIQNSNLETSLYHRFIRHGVSLIELDSQALYRPSLYSLIQWNYAKPISTESNESEEMKRANQGFCFDFQFVNVEEYLGVGESQPRPLFYQNLGEAEYAVAIFQYMRLVGYPADKITILTSYNGQKELILDVLAKRCAWHPFFGSPKSVSTVDNYDSQRNDYVILSLVRTSTPDKMRDTRWILSSLTRARLGLIILGRESVFSKCLEWNCVFKLLNSRPTDELWIYKDETFENSNRMIEQIGVSLNKKSGKWSPMKGHAVSSIKNVEAMGVLVHELTNKKLDAFKASKVM